ncbi:uncharacterized protein LOC143283563 [Babylonia areolata]|uniref:uncharacterized protein LOC143283563 n=1 Tax=Babylonia areolata TaxID=304850 RepID=UPI003FD696FB
MADSALPTLCEVAYDQLWDDEDTGSARVDSFRGVPVSSRATPSHTRFNGYGWSSNLAAATAQSGPPRNCVSVQCYAEDSYYDYLRNYYWEQPAGLYNGGTYPLPTLPPRSNTTQGVYGVLDVEGAQLGQGAARWDHRLLSLPSLHRPETVELEWREKRLCDKPRLKWFDSLNAWVPINKSTRRHPYLHFINSPPRVDRNLNGKEGVAGVVRHSSGEVSGSGQHQPPSSTSSLQQSSGPELSRKSRSVRFDASHACHSPLQHPQPGEEGEEEEEEEEELSQAVALPPPSPWDSEVVVDTLDELPVQALQGLHPGQGTPTALLAQPSSVTLQQTLQAVVLSNDAATWCGQGQEGQEEEEEEEEGQLPVEPEAETIKQDFGPYHPVTSDDVTASAPVVAVSSSPGPACDDVIPLALPSTDAEPRLSSYLPSYEEMQSFDFQLNNKAVKERQTTHENMITVTSYLQWARAAPPNRARPSVSKPSVRMVKPAKARSLSKEKKERAAAPKAAPKTRPVKEKKKVRLIDSDESDDGPEDRPIPLPISGPEDMIWTPEPQDDPPPPTSLPVTRTPVKKKERLPPPPPRRPTPSPPPTPPGVGRHPRVSFMYGPDHVDVDTGVHPGEEGTEDVTGLLRVTPLPELPTTPLPSSTSTRRSSFRSQMTPSPLSSRKGGAGGGEEAGAKARWGQRRRDRSLREQEERERVAEERRRRHALKVERYHKVKAKDAGGERVEDDGFLAKYCILNPSTTEQYRYTFEQLDEGQKDHLTEEELVYALRAINPNLSVSERTYLFRVMQLAGQRVRSGTDFRLFSILAALSQRVSRLDDWVRSMMANLDYRTLERKMFLCKALWECNRDEEDGEAGGGGGSISLDQLVVELRAGGVGPQQEQEVRQKLAQHRRLDFLDFLLYVPLFVHIHQTVLTDPLTASPAL